MASALDTVVGHSLCSVGVLCHGGASLFHALFRPLAELRSRCHRHGVAVLTAGLGQKSSPVFHGLAHHSAVGHIYNLIHRAVLGKHRICAVERALEVLHLQTAHNQIVAGVHIAGLVGLGTPVSHEQALKSPLAPDNVLQQLLVFGGVTAVDTVVGSHDRSRLRLPHRNLKSLQIDLPQRPLGYGGVGCGPIKLLVVAGEMLDGNLAAPVALYALREGRGAFSGNQGILRIVLEASAAEGIPVDVHTRPQNHGLMVSGHLDAKAVSHFFQDVQIPGLSQRNTHRPSRCREADNVQSRRTVGHVGVGNAQSLHILAGGLSGGCGRLGKGNLFLHAVLHRMGRLVGDPRHQAKQHTCIQRGDKLLQRYFPLLHVQQRRVRHCADFHDLLRAGIGQLVGVLCDIGSVIASLRHIGYGLVRRLGPQIFCVEGIRRQ